MKSPTDKRFREEIYEALRTLGAATPSRIAREIRHPGEDLDTVSHRIRAILRCMVVGGLVHRIYGKSYEVIDPGLAYSEAVLIVSLRSLVFDAVSLGYSKSKIHDLVDEALPPTFTLSHLVGLPREEAEEWREEVE